MGFKIVWWVLMILTGIGSGGTASETKRGVSLVLCFVCMAVLTLLMVLAP